MSTWDGKERRDSRIGERVATLEAWAKGHEDTCVARYDAIASRIGEATAMIKSLSGVMWKVGLSIIAALAMALFILLIDGRIRPLMGG